MKMSKAANTRQEHEEALETMATPEFFNDLLSLLRIRAPIVYITTNEEKRMQNYFKHLAVAKAYHVFKWDCYLGLVDLLNEKKGGASTEDIREPEVVLDKIIEQAQQDQKNQEAMISEGYKGNIYLLLDFHRFLEDAPASIERRLKHLASIESMTTVIITGPHFTSTPALDNEFAVLDFPYPNSQEISDALWTLVKSDNVRTKLPKLAEVVKEREHELIKAANGLTLNEAHTAFSKSVVIHRDFDIPTILKEKQQIIRKKGILEYCKPTVSMKDIGGLRKMIHWFERRKLAFHPDAEKYGLRTPRGVLFVGVPGVGKSLTAKAIASLYEMPLLRLDFGRLFGSLVGQSEQSARDAIKLSETIAPCIAGDTEIFTTDGRWLSARDILTDNKYVSVGTCSFDIETYKNTIDQVCAVIKHPSKKRMLEVSSWFGKVKITYDHELMVNREGNFGWVRAKDLLVGDLLLAPKKLFRNIKPLHFLECFDENARLFGRDLWNKYSRYLHYRDRSCRKHRKSYFIKKTEAVGIPDSYLPERIVIGGGGFRDSTCVVKSFELEKLYYLLGLIDSDGYLSNISTTVGFVNTNLKLHQVFTELMSSMFHVEVKIRLTPERKEGNFPFLEGLSENPVFQKCYVSYFSNKVLHKMFSYARSQLFCQPDGVIKKYLSGYFDGDGCITLDKAGQPRLIFCSNKKESWKRIRTALHILGVLSPGCQKGYSVTIGSFDDVRTVSNWLSICHPKKKDIIARIRSSTFSRSSHRSRGYSLGRLLRAERKRLGVMSNTFACSSSAISYIENNDKLVTEDTMKVISARLLDSGSQVNKIFNSDVVGVKVTNIKPIGERDCYDLSIKNNHNFFANGILSKNCILWVDEVEKGIAGSKSSGQTDGGTTSRVVSTFLTWLQEKVSPVFVVCTANDHMQIPPEFMRAGRFDEIFFIDLPSPEERCQIFEVLLRRFGRDPKQFDLALLASVSEGYSGAEIEKAIECAMFEGFNDKQREIVTEDVKKAVGSFHPLSEMRHDVFDDMRKWAESYCVLANGVDEDQDSVPKAKKSKANIDLSL